MSTALPGRRLAELDPLTKPADAELYGVKGGVPYRVRVGGPSGLPVYDEDGKLPGNPEALRAELAALGADKGAAIVSFVQVGANAVARTVADKLRESKSLADCGAVGDGTTDDTAAIRKALADAQETPIDLKAVPGAVYRLSEGLGAYDLSGTSLDLTGATLDFTGVATASSVELLTVVNALGLVAASAAITADAAAGARSISCNTAGFAVGDVVRVRSDAIFDSTRTNTRLGEMLVVEEITSGTAMKFTTELQDSYATANAATVDRLRPVRDFRLTGGLILGPTAPDETTGLRLVGGYDCHVAGISMIGVDQRAVRFEDCQKCSVTGSSFREAHNDSQGYGVSFTNCCQDCIASGNFFTDVRHSLSTNNSTATYGLSRRILFMGNNVTDSAPALGGGGGDAIDTHSAAEDIFILNNVVHSASGNGVNIEGASAIVRGNWIKNCQASGININPYADRVSSFAVEDNTILNPGLNTTAYGINCTARAANGENYSVTRNRIKGSPSRPIRVVNINSKIISRINICGNTIDQSGGGAYGIEIDACSWVVANGNNIRVNAVAATQAMGLYFKNSSVCIVNGNAIEIAGTGTDVYGVNISGTSSNHAIVGNTFWRSGTFSGLKIAVQANAAVTNSTVVGNTSNMTYNATGAGVVTANNS